MTQPPKKSMRDSESAKKTKSPGEAVARKKLSITLDAAGLVEQFKTDRINYDGGRSSQIVVDKPFGDLLQDVVQLLRDLTGWRHLAANKVLKIAATEWLEETKAALEAIRQAREIRGEQ